MKQVGKVNLQLAKLDNIQERASDEEGGQDRMMIKGHTGTKAASRFLELKASILTQIESARKMIEDHPLTHRKQHYNSLSNKDSIAAQAAIRESICRAMNEWDELNNIYKREARKKKSKISAEGLKMMEGE